MNRTVLIFDLLHPGAENGIKLSELAALTNQDEREVRRRIQTERKDGKLICRTACTDISCPNVRKTCSALPAP